MTDPKKLFNDLSLKLQLLHTSQGFIGLHFGNRFTFMVAASCGPMTAILQLFFLLVSIILIIFKTVIKLNQVTG